MNRLLEMEVFVRVVDAGSISAAAESMDMAKSAVSRRLGELESRLGVQLLNRTTRRLSLTAAGDEFYGRCYTVLSDVAEAESEVSADRGTIEGRIRVAAPLSFGLEHLAPALDGFMQAHPKLILELDFNDRIVDLLGEGFDLAIRIAQLSDSSFVARNLAPIRNVICASPAYWDEHGRPAHPDDLKQHQSLRYTLVPHRSWHYTAKDGNRGSVTLPSRISANNGAYLSEVAASGAGVVRMPLFVVYKLIESKALEPVLLDYQWGDLSAWAVYPKTRHLPYRVRALIETLANTFGSTPYWERCLN